MKTKNSIFGICLLVMVSTNAQSVLGKWTTLDDNTGVKKSVVEIYQDHGKVFGKVIQILEKGKENRLCDKCKGNKKDKPVKDMIIINGLEKNTDTWEGGTILDPETGKEYKCYITLENDNKLKVRGYIGISFIGRTQYWNRLID